MAAAAVVSSIMPPPLNNKQQQQSVQRLPIATASGLLALLSEPDPTLVQHALSKLLLVVDTLWHEIAESLPDLETIAEGGQPNANAAAADNDDNHDTDMADNNNNAAGVVYDNSTRQKAAALASRVFFHLEEPRQALRLALESGSEYFNVLSPKVEDVAYVERLVNAAIGEYVKKRREEFDGGSSASTTSKKEEEVEEEEELDMDKLQTVVHLMFERCYQDKHYGHALGVAFESMEKDKVEEILDRLLLQSSSSSSSDDDDENNVVTTLKYALQSAQTLITSKNFRLEALSLVASTLEKFLEQKGGSSGSGKEKKYASSNSKEAACTLVLCRQLLGDADAVGKIITELIDTSSSSSSLGEDNGSDDTALLGLQLCFDIVDSGDEAFVTKVAKCLPKAEEGGNDDAAADTSRPATTLAYFTNAHRVLTGGFTSELSLSFLYKNSNFDKLIMTNLKKALEERSMSRNSVLHNCAVTAHGYLTAGTTNDSFLRDNLDWMKKASNWYVCSTFSHQHLTFHTTCLLTYTLPVLDTCFIFY